jgi:hypothetical protein
MYKETTHYKHYKAGLSPLILQAYLGILCFNFVLYKLNYCNE